MNVVVFGAGKRGEKSWKRTELQHSNLSLYSLSSLCVWLPLARCTTVMVEAFFLLCFIYPESTEEIIHSAGWVFM